MGEAVVDEETGSTTSRNGRLLEEECKTEFYYSAGGQGNPCGQHFKGGQDDFEYCMHLLKNFQEKFNYVICVEMGVTGVKKWFQGNPVRKLIKRFFEAIFESSVEYCDAVKSAKPRIYNIEDSDLKKDIALLAGGGHDESGLVTGFR